MPPSNTSLYVHFVWSTKNRQPLIVPEMRDRLYAYMGGIVRKLGGVLLCAGGVSDHVHLACSLNTRMCIADTARDIKSNSSGWVHDELRMADFARQIGYGAFTVSYSVLPRLRAYIHDQEAHHRRMTFQEEFLALLKKHGVEYDERYIWD
jgi:putative transposase